MKKENYSHFNVTNIIFSSVGFADWFVGLSRYRISLNNSRGRLLFFLQKKGEIIRLLF